MLVLGRPGMPRWAVPVLGALLFTALTALWLTSSLWFFGTSGLVFPRRISLPRPPRQRLLHRRGTPTGGPARQPLPERAVSIEGGSIVLA